MSSYTFCVIALQAFALFNFLSSCVVGELAQDYNPRPDPRFFNFQPGAATRMCTDFTIVVDQEFEALVEDFFADLQLTATERVTIAPMRTTIGITDVDGARLLLLKSSPIYAM